MTVVAVVVTGVVAVVAYSGSGQQPLIKKELLLMVVYGHCQLLCLLLVISFLIN